MRYLPQLCSSHKLVRMYYASGYALLLIEPQKSFSFLQHPFVHNCRDFVQRYYGRPMSDASYRKLESGANDQGWLSKPPDKTLIRGTVALLRRDNQAVYELFQGSRMRDLLSDKLTAGQDRRNCEQVLPWHSSTKYAMKEVVRTPWVSKALVQQNPYMAQVVVNDTAALNKRPRR